MDTRIRTRLFATARVQHERHRHWTNAGRHRYHGKGGFCYRRSALVDIGGRDAVGWNASAAYAGWRTVQEDAKVRPWVSRPWSRIEVNVLGSAAPTQLE